MLEPILAAFGIHEGRWEPVGAGLIHHTWKVDAAGNEYILQRVNDQVFQDPMKIAKNIRMISSYLQQHHPGYYFTTPRCTADGKDMLHDPSLGWFRMFPFVPGAQSKEVVHSPEEAYEAAAQFGKFTRLLSGFGVQQLEITLPHFHDLDLRYRQFSHALQNGNSGRIHECREEIKALQSHVSIVDHYRKLVQDPKFRHRVTHHDTKISNVLFDARGKGICVIDLDTVMPGLFISDVGDMMRTYLSPVSEEEQDLSRITVRTEVYHAIVEGYRSQMDDLLSQEENGQFFYAGTFLIYMQALRFLTDHLNNDVYYGARYEGHNRVRACNQLELLRQLESVRGVLEKR